jgi:chemotaxis protein methyltransferase CheR
MDQQGEIALSEREFARVKARVYEQAGISLSDAKRTLVVSRLSKVVRTLRLNSFDAYLDFLERGGSERDAQDFINALTTNLTRFYREDHHFDHLVSYVGQLIERRPRNGAGGKPRLRIWSAGCSTGQEPYTIALCLLDAHPELKRWDFRILATDIDTNVLDKAAQGIYPDSELNGLSPARERQFERAGDGTIRIPLAARSLIAFKPLNLMQQWPVKGPFDAIFCRNVAIYFDKPTQGQLFSRLGKLLAPEAFLYIGHSENLGTGGDGFRLVGKTIYQTKSLQKTRDAA